MINDRMGHNDSIINIFPLLTFCKTEKGHSHLLFEENYLSVVKQILSEEEARKKLKNFRVKRR